MRTTTGPLVDITLDHASHTPLYQQIYSFLREAIASGSIAEGSRLPSVREARAAWGVSRPTVERAYLQLVVEGYVDSLPRSGYVVRRLDSDFLSRALLRRATETVDVPQQRIDFIDQFGASPGIAYDFAFARLAPGSFPAKQWLKLVSDAVYYDADDLLCGYPGDHRPNALQVQLQGYLHRTRGVSCDPAQVLVLPSTQWALETIVQLFDPAADTIGVEEPGYLTLVDVARRLGFPVAAIASDQGPDRFLDDVGRQCPKMLFVTPSHQFPTGKVMPLGVRIELLKWAEATDAFIVEDDSCSEYRFGTDPVPSLQSLDANGRVVYLGNFSKALAPGLRVAYAVLPPGLLRRYYERFALSGTGVSTLLQRVLADFIEGGYLDQHVRRMVAQTRARHDLLLAGLQGQFGDSVEIEGVGAGMHLFVTVKDAPGQDRLLETAAREGAKVYRSDYYWFANPAPADKVLVGFSAIDPGAIAPGVAALARACGAVSGG